MSLALMAWAWDQTMPPMVKFVLVTLTDYADLQGGCFPSIGRLAQRTSMSERSVQRAVAALEAAGVLTRREDKQGKLWFYIKHGVLVVDVRKASEEVAPKWLRDEVMATGAGCCHWCNRSGSAAEDPDGRKWTVDRLVPGRKGGKYEPGNVVLACFSCNSKKGAMSVDQFLKYSQGGDAQSPPVTDSHRGVTDSHPVGDRQSPDGVTDSHPNRQREPSDEPSVNLPAAAGGDENGIVVQSHHTKFIADWCEYSRLRHKGTKYDFQPKDARAVKHLLQYFGTPEKAKGFIKSCHARTKEGFPFSNTETLCYLANNIPQLQAALAQPPKAGRHGATQQRERAAATQYPLRPGHGPRTFDPMAEPA